MRRRRWRRRSGAGAHQFQLPRIAISDGTRSALTIVASSATATAVPTPSSCTNTSRDVANEPIATQKSSAAAVTMRPVRSRPHATAARVRLAAVVRLLDAREQEDRVVGRETEHGRGEQDGLRLLEPLDAGAVLEDEHEHAERRSDRERVHHAAPSAAGRPSR